MCFEWIFLVYCTRTCTFIWAWFYMYIFQHLKCIHNFNFIVHVIDSGLYWWSIFFLHAFKVATGSFVASGRCLNQNDALCIQFIWWPSSWAYCSTCSKWAACQKYSFWGKKPYSTVRQLFVANELIADQSCL